MKKMMTLIVVIALVAIMVSPAAARMGMREGYGHGHYYAADITTVPDLTLTGEQVTKLNALRDTHLRDIKPLQDQLFNQNGELRLLWLERTPDQKKILTIQKEVRTLRDQLYDKQTAYRLEVQEVLTPEQQMKLKAYGAGRGYGSGKGIRDQGGMGMDPGMGRGMRGY
jgi:Spy/CpxP family protein refolding chaperone